MIVWLTGRSGAGKSTLANGLLDHLHWRGKAVVLDTDNLSCVELASRYVVVEKGDTRKAIELRCHMLNRELAYLAKEVAESGVHVICVACSQFEEDREYARCLVEVQHGFFLVHVSCPREELVRRDTRGLYSGKATPAHQEWLEFYEVPTKPDCTVHTEKESAHWSLEKIKRVLNLREIEESEVGADV